MGGNGTARPGAVYLAAALAAYAQKGLPAFSIYGHDVQDMGDKTVPADVTEKILNFAKCAVAVGWMKNKVYLKQKSPWPKHRSFRVATTGRYSITQR